MKSFILLGLLTGLDNLRVGIGVGSLGLQRRRRLALAAGFALFEATMPLAGLWLGRGALSGLEPFAEGISVGLLAAVGAAVLVPLLAGVDLTERIARSPFLLAMAPILSLDNLLAGATLAGSGASYGLVFTGVGLLSGAVSLAGLSLGSRLASGSAARPAVAGCLLLASAAAGLIG